jgi:hypothetical protein
MADKQVNLGIKINARFQSNGGVTAGSIRYRLNFATSKETHLALWQKRTEVHMEISARNPRIVPKVKCWHANSCHI